MSKRENEAVVNRFLLSTVYIILFEMFLFFMCKYECGKFAFSLFAYRSFILMGIAIIGLALSIYFFVRYFVMKKGSLYYGILFLVFGLSGVFLQTIYKFCPYMTDTVKRYGFLSLLYLAFYVYELIVYFVRVNK